MPKFNVPLIKGGIISLDISSIVYKKKGKVDIKNVNMDINIKSIKQKQGGILSIEFEYVYTYSENAKIVLTGKISMKSTKEESKRIYTTWKEKRKIPDEFFSSVMNSIYVSTTPIMVGIANSLALPSIVVPPFKKG